MPFREKTAWVMTALLTALGIYYLQAVLAQSQRAVATAPPDTALILLVTILLVAGAVAAHIVLAVTAPQDANVPEDERDKLVLWRAGIIAGYVLGFGVFAALWHFYFQKDGNVMFHILAMALIVSQIAEYVLQIIFYRRGV